MSESESESTFGFVIILTGLVVLVVFYGYMLHYSKKTERLAWEREKQCYRVLTDIVQQSSAADAEWIKKTVFAEKGALSRADYCTVLEFVQASGLQQPKVK